MYKVVCAWCHKHMRGLEDAEIVSYGICTSCTTKVLSDVPEASVSPEMEELRRISILMEEQSQFSREQDKYDEAMWYWRDVGGESGGA